METDYDTYTYAFDGINYTGSWMNPIEKREFGYGTGSPGSIARKTAFTYLHQGNPTYKDKHILNLPISQKVSDGVGSWVAQADFFYDTVLPNAQTSASDHDYTGYPRTMNIRGNLTLEKVWRNTDGAWLTTTHKYDELGNRIESLDPLGHKTTVSYADNWAQTSCLPAGGSAFAYPKTATNHLGHVTTNKYYSCTGFVESTTDPNGQTISWDFDNMDRLTREDRPDLGYTANTFDDSGQKVTRKVLLFGSTLATAEFQYDDLFRIVQSRLTSDPQGTTYVRTDYDKVGRKKKVWNPSRCDLFTAPTTPPSACSGETTFGLTEFEYDGLSRVEKVIPPDGTTSSNHVFTDYSGNCTTVTDQASKKRKSCSDALGRLTQLYEPNSSGSLVNLTSYTYDVLDNLTNVTQVGSRQRTFTYNSLSQLTQAVNPESGTINYTYDNDGNLKTKVAPKPNQTGSLTVTTTFNYDTLHRLTSKTYTDGTPSASYFYDQTSYNGLTIANGKGRRTGMSDTSGATAWSFDTMGREVSTRKTISGLTYSLTHSYDKGGNMTRIVLPSGRNPLYTYNAASRLTTVNYAGLPFQNGLYHPGGQLKSFTYGDSTIATFSYNKRLQPTSYNYTRLGETRMNIAYNFSLGTANNGNVTSMNVSGTAVTPGTHTETLTYDELNRVKTAVVTGGTSPWGLTYGYDIWANLLTKTVTSGSPPGLSISVNTKNQVTSETYDAVGNMTTNPMGSGSQTYDAENRVISAGGASYTYDGDGNRVKKVSGSVTTRYMRSGVLGQVVWEGDNGATWTREHFYAAGQKLLTYDVAGNFYSMWDHLGTPRYTSLNSVKRTFGNYLFGGAWYDTGQNSAYKFTGQERDSETGLDYFIARHYASNLGRFLQVDPVALSPQKMIDPQQFNMYSYSRNNPLRYIDPNGEEVSLADLDEEERKKLIAELEKKSGLKLAFNAKSGNLDIVGKGIGGSATFRQGLSDAIGSDTVFNVVNASRGPEGQQIVFGAFDKRTNTVFLDFADFEQSRPGLSLGQTFFHETVGHGVRGLPDQRNSSIFRLLFGTDATRETLKVSRELGLPELRVDRFYEGPQKGKYFIKVFEPRKSRLRELFIAPKVQKIDITDAVNNR